MTDLSPFSWHTGGPVRPLDEGERAPALFRDLGPTATLALLDGRLPRLAGPTSPVTYSRTARYVEPYDDHEHFGRVAILPWSAARPWRSGVAEVFVLPAEARFDPRDMALVPDHADLARVAREAPSMRSIDELREHLGAALVDEWSADLRPRLARFEAELARVESVLAPLRARYQSPRRDDRERARAWIDARGLDERDLCAPWHHLPRERRAFVLAALDGSAP
ncbi:MAG: hypothetical protein R3A52_28850 [Polyangiales bacterium]